MLHQIHSNQLSDTLITNNSKLNLVKYLFKNSINFCSRHMAENNNEPFSNCEQKAEK